MQKESLNLDFYKLLMTQVNQIIPKYKSQKAGESFKIGIIFSINSEFISYSIFKELILLAKGMFKLTTLERKIYKEEDSRMLKMTTRLTLNLANF